MQAFIYGRSDKILSINLPEIEYYIEYKIPAVAKHIDTWEILRKLVLSENISEVYV